MQNRREFLKLSAAGALGVAALSQFSCGSKTTTANTEPVDKKSFGAGLILYTVRDAMGVDLPEGSVDKVATLKRISDMGYKYLELANYSNGLFYGYTPQEFKKIVNDLGMEILSRHTQVEAAGITLENAQKMADDHAVLGVKYCVQPWVNDEDRTIDKYKKMIADWNQVGEIMKNTGIQFGFKFHNFEFVNIDGVVPYYDIFMPEMDPNLITMELDLFWASKAGQDPVDMFNRYPGRFQLLHFKDMATQQDPFYTIIKDDIRPVGAGIIDFKRIWQAKDIAGAKYFFVEDDNQGMGAAGATMGVGESDPETTFNAIQTSIDNLTSSILVA
jgi:sugar phosphate isomerase/epimerase